MRKIARGRYRTDATQDRPARAYVIDGVRAYFVTEEAYRAKKFDPAFDTLPTEDDYDA